MYKEAQGYVRLTFQLADLRLTVRPLLVTVHFIRMKKSRLVLCSLLFFPKLLAGNKKKKKGNEYITCFENICLARLLLVYTFLLLFC